MSEKGVQVIDRVFDILELLSLEKEGLGVTEIGNRVGLHKSTVHRILSAMAERGYVEKIPSKSLYRIGLKLVEVGSVYLNSIELKTEASPYLRELAAKLKQPVHLAILDGTDAVYIDKVDAINSIRLYSQIGRRIPVYCSALGKSLLSGMTDKELDETAEKCSFTKYTASTLDRAGFMRQVREAGKMGWSVDNEEHEEGIRCIAAPVYDYRKKVIAAVSVAGPSLVFSREGDAAVAMDVKDAAAKISARMGYK